MDCCSKGRPGEFGSTLLRMANEFNIFSCPLTWTRLFLVQPVRSKPGILSQNAPLWTAVPGSCRVQGRHPTEVPRTGALALLPSVSPRKAAEHPQLRHCCLLDEPWYSAFLTCFTDTQGGTNYVEHVVSHNFWEQLLWEQKCILLKDNKLNFNGKQMLRTLSATAVSQRDFWPSE